MYAKKLCDVCEKEFQPTSPRDKRCSKECRLIAQKQLQAASYLARKMPNRCRTCRAEIEKWKRYCEAHRIKKLYSIGYVDALKNEVETCTERDRLNASIIRHQQVMLDDMAQKIAILKDENKDLEVTVNLARSRNSIEGGQLDYKAPASNRTRNKHFLK